MFHFLRLEQHYHFDVILRLKKSLYSNGIFFFNYLHNINSHIIPQSVFIKIIIVNKIKYFLGN